MNSKILQSQSWASVNRSNDFQAYLAGLAVSSQNDRGRQKTQGQNFFPPHSILPCRPKIFKRPTSTKIQWIFDQLCPVSGKNGIYGGSTCLLKNGSALLLDLGKVFNWPKYLKALIEAHDAVVIDDMTS